MDFVSFQNVILKYLSKITRNKVYQNKSKEKANNRPNVSGSTAVKATENDLNYFKSIVVTPASMDEIKEKLKLTAQLREKKVKEMKLDFLEQFPIFYTHPILVI